MSQNRAFPCIDFIMLHCFPALQAVHWRVVIVHTHMHCVCSHQGWVGGLQVSIFSQLWVLFYLWICPFIYRLSDGCSTAPTPHLLQFRSNTEGIFKSLPFCTQEWRINPGTVKMGRGAISQKSLSASESWGIWVLRAPGNSAGYGILLQTLYTERDTLGKEKQNLTWCLESGKPAPGREHGSPLNKPRFASPPAREISDVLPRECLTEGGIPFIYSHQGSDPPPLRKGFSCFRCELSSSHHGTGWPLKHFKWITDGSPDKWTASGQP